MPLLKETQSLLPPLEEMEKNITGFYQALEKASHITSNTDSEGPVDFKQKCQVTRSVPVSVTPTQVNFPLDLAAADKVLCTKPCRSWRPSRRAVRSV